MIHFAYLLICFHCSIHRRAEPIGISWQKYNIQSRKYQCIAQERSSCFADLRSINTSYSGHIQDSNTIIVKSAVKFNCLVNMWELRWFFSPILVGAIERIGCSLQEWCIQSARLRAVFIIHTLVASETTTNHHALSWGFLRPSYRATSLMQSKFPHERSPWYHSKVALKEGWSFIRV